jgi:hypothetical protein
MDTLGHPYTVRSGLLLRTEVYFPFPAGSVEAGRTQRTGCTTVTTADSARQAQTRQTMPIFRVDRF